MSEITPPEPPGPSTGDRSARSRGVAVAAVVVALAGYLVILVAAHTLTKAENADFLSYWGLLFFCSGVMAGIQSEATRAVHTSRMAPDERRRTSVLAVGLGLGAAVAVLVLATAPLWESAVLGSDPDPTILLALVAIGTVGFAGHNAVIGTLAGNGRWTAFSWLLGGEAMARLALTLVAAVITLVRPQVGLPAAAALAALTWVVVLTWPGARAVRAAARTRVAGTAGGLVRRMAPAMIGAASSATLLVGFPIMLRLTTEGPEYALAAPLLLAVQLTRAPLMVPLGAFQGVAITHVLDHGAAALTRIGAIIVGIGAVGAAAAWAVGPWVMLIFGSGYRVPGAVLAGLTAGAATLALLTLSGAMTIALGRHRLFAVGWFLAAAVTVVLLVVGPDDVATRAVLALAVGPLVGVVCHLVPTARSWTGRH